MKGVFLVRRKKGLIIDPSDICYEEECEEIGFESPDKIKGNFMHIHRDLCMKKNIRIVFQYRIMIDIYHNLAGRSEDAL